MFLTCHHFPWAFSPSLLRVTTHESPVIDEELEKAQIGRSKMLAQAEIVPQSRIEILH